MSKNEIVKRNLDLLNEFMQYAYEHPDILDRIPSNSELIILPDDDKELYAENLKVMEKLRKKKKSITIIRLKRPKPILPKIELLPA
jgi:hypothetical protein